MGMFAMNTDTFGGRVKAERKGHRWTQMDLAARTNQSQSNISAIERDEYDSSRCAYDLARAFNMPIDALLDAKAYERYKSGELSSFVIVGGDQSGQEPTPDKYVVISQYDLHGSCGSGELIGDVVIKGGLVFDRQWLKNQNLPSPEDLAVIYAKGESMYPCIEDGQVLLVNAVFGEIISGKIYLICIDGQMFIKRLINMVTHWVIRSDNPDKSTYPDIQMTKDQLRQIDVQGRVVWKAGEL